MNCPICETAIQNFTEQQYPNGDSEAQATCTDEHHAYTYRFEQGIITETIGRVVFRRYPEDNAAYQKTQRFQRKFVLQLEQGHYYREKGETNDRSD